MNTDFEFQLPKNQSSQIKVMGIGGGGSNAVNYMFQHGIKGVDFVICNTDSQALEASPVPTKIQLGSNLTEGLGAGSNPSVGKQAAEESSDRISELLDANTKMLFLTAGMGGGTGTGAAPIIAEIAREKGILTIGVVTNPFSTEGGYRKQYAKEGLDELRKYVDTLLIINNDKLIEVYGDLTLSQAFAKANEVLNTATKGIAEVISQHLLVNIDLNDARKVLENSGTAVMGQAEATGENRAIEAVNAALDSPLLNDSDITGAEQVLLKIVTGDGDDEIKMSELNKIKNKIQEAAGKDVNIIEGIGIDAELDSAVSVTVIATGFEIKTPKDKKTINLDENTNLDAYVDKDIKSSSTIQNNTSNREGQQQIFNLEEKEIMTNSLDEIIEEVDTTEASMQIEEKKIVVSLDGAVDNPDEFITSIVAEDEQEEPTITFTLDDDIKEIENQEECLNTLEGTTLNNNSLKIESREREDRLRTISMKLRTPLGLTDLEDVPAYKRNNVDLEQTDHSSESEVSRYTLSEGEDKKIELKPTHPFLHDNVD